LTIVRITWPKEKTKRRLLGGRTPACQKGTRSSTDNASTPGQKGEGGPWNEKGAAVTEKGGKKVGAAKISFLRSSRDRLHRREASKDCSKRYPGKRKGPLSKSSSWGERGANGKGEMKKILMKKF